MFSEKSIYRNVHHKNDSVMVILCPKRVKYAPLLSVHVSVVTFVDAQYMFSVYLERKG